MSDLSNLKLDVALSQLIASASKHYPDPGPDGYDPAKEDQVRSLAELTSFYDEAGPRSDPDGHYLCGTCSLRQGEDKCLYVKGDISFTTGGCYIYVHGEPLSEDYELKEKFSQEEVGYGERPDGWGCAECEYSAEAKAPDPDGRPSWCREWGMHIDPKSCCMRFDADDIT